MSEDMFDEWGEWAEETLMKGISEIKEEKKKLKEAINKIKETSFYKEYIDKMYVCKENLLLIHLKNYFHFADHILFLY